MKSVEVVAAIIRRGGRILAAQRGYGELEGGWEFPGGKVEQGETREAALVREIREELDAELRIDGFFKTLHHDNGRYRMVLHCYLCSLPDGRFRLIEHSDVRWLRRDEVDSVDWLPADEEIVRALLEATLPS